MEYSWTASVFIAVSEGAMVVLCLAVVAFCLWWVGVSDRREAKEKEQRRKEEELYGKEDSNPLESQNDTNRLLRQIEANTAKIAFWTRVVGVPVLIGLIIGALAGLTQC